MNSVFMLYPCKDPANAPVQVEKLSPWGCAPCDHDNVTAEVIFCQQFSEYLSETTFNSVPRHGIPDLSAYSKAEPAVIKAIVLYVKDEVLGRKFPALLKDVLEFVLSSQGLKNGILQTASLFRPFFLLLLITERPPTVLILTRKPCVRFCFFVCG